MKNWLKFHVGDKVHIVRSHSDDLDKTGVIVEVRPSFCKIQIDGEYLQNRKPLIKNHTYGQFTLITNDNTELTIEDLDKKEELEDIKADYWINEQKNGNLA